MALACACYILQAKELSDNLPPAPAPARAKNKERCTISELLNTKETH